MSDGIEVLIGDDGVARMYDDTYDITIHCETQEEHDEVLEMLQGSQWIPCSDRLPDDIGYYTVTKVDKWAYFNDNQPYETVENRVVDDVFFDGTFCCEAVVIAWRQPRIKPYGGETSG